MTTLAAFVAADEQYPVAHVRVTNGGTDYDFDNIQRIDWTRAYDQQIATFSVTTATSPTIGGAPILPSAKDPIKFLEGYEESDGTGEATFQTFYGFVDSVTLSSFPDSWEIKGRDVLGRAADFWYGDRGITFTSVLAETAIQTILGDAGLTSFAMGSTSFLIGDLPNHPARFGMMSGLDACNQIADLVGWHLWADRLGTVHFALSKPKPAATSTATIQTGPTGTILKYSMENTIVDLRNRVMVLGYQAPGATTALRKVVSASSSYLAANRTVVYSSEMVDTQPMADSIAATLLSDLNHSNTILTVTTIADPTFQVGATFRVIMPDRFFGSFDELFYVFSIHSTMDGDTGQYVYEMVLIAWDVLAF